MSMAEELLRTQRITDFTRALASAAPAPGGGGAAALTGALAAALCAMVPRLTVGRRQYAAVEADVTEILARADTLYPALLQLIDADRDGFLPLAAAYAIPKDDPDRRAAMEQALDSACAAPMQMMRRIAEVVELLEQLLDKGSAMVISDVGVGAELARAALSAAAMNIFVNTAWMQDLQQKQALNAEAETLLSDYTVRAASVSEQALLRIRGKE